MRTKSLLLFLIASLFLSLSVFASDGTAPVRWRTFVTCDGDNGILTFRALVSSGWHLYGLELPTGGPKPTVFDLSGSVGVKFEDSVKPQREASKVEDPLFGMTLNWWDSNVEFTVPFKVTEPGNARIDCKITYMACNGETCMPPKTENISAVVKQAK